jgi:hypothetical protein
MSRRSAVVIGLAAGVIALGGCGGGKARLSKAGYSRDVTAVFVELRTQFTAAGAGATNAETSKALRSLTSALRHAAQRLDALSPPSHAEDDHSALVAEVRDYARQVDLLRASVDFGDPVTIASHLREVTAPHTIQRTIRDLRAKGYRIPVTVVALH